jgi:hypothetical protein
VKLSVARKAVDSTLRRILSYTTEIIMSIVLLVVICIPLAFVVPMWLQLILLNRPRNNLALDPVRWFRLDGAVWLTLLLGLVSFVLGYFIIYKLKPGISSEENLEAEKKIEDEEDDELELDMEEKELEAETEEEESAEELETTADQSSEELSVDTEDETEEID